MATAHVLLALLGTISLAEQRDGDAPQGAPDRRPAAAILHEPGMPARGCPSAVEVMAQILAKAGVSVEMISADQLADGAVLTKSRFDILVVPTGETFPAAARPALVEFLRSGGDLVATGGYAFQDLVRRVDGQWISERERVEVNRQQAMRDERSLLVDSGFESAAEAPVGGDAIDGRWRRSSASAFVSRESPYRGTQCVRVVLREGEDASSGGYHAKVPVVPGRHYCITAAIRANAVRARDRLRRRVSIRQARRDG